MIAILFLRTNLEKEIDNQLLKEKIIEDQFSTISQLQLQIKEKTQELSDVKEASSMAEDVLEKVNNNLVQKNIELDREMKEKKRLVNKLRVSY